MTVETSADPPDPGRARTLNQLVGLLRALKLWAGNPSYDTITRRVNARWRDAGRPEGELTRRGTVVDCFKAGRRRINSELTVAVVQALHDDAGYITHWQQALRVILVETAAATQVRVLDRLPADAPVFTGRRADLARLRRAAETAGEPIVCVLAGMAGVGKTQVALRAGHLLAESFDTTLFVDLRGFHPDPGQPPVDPAAVLDGFLRLLGVSGHEVPYDVRARAALFRERLAGRRALVVLDNAATQEQVRPLLPDGAGTLTLITSRRRLTDPAMTARFDIEVFTAEEAEQFLAGTVPGVAVGPDPSAYRRVARRCGYLPLALSVVAGRMAAMPGWSVSDHADRLDERRSFGRLDTGVELALDLSYQDLPACRQTLLRRMAMHPGPDLDDTAAAAMLDTDVDTAAGHLCHLAGECLVQQPVDGRYNLHDLVRAHAQNRARDEDRRAERRAALTRLFDHYLYGAAAAMNALYPAEAHRRPTLAPRSTKVQVSDDPKAALRWLDSERTTLVAACLYTAGNGWPEHAVQLAGTVYAYLDNGGYSADAVAVHTAARRAARLVGDRTAEATALTNLGVGCWQLGRHADAIGHFERALSLFRKVGDGCGEARTLGNLGLAHSAAGQLQTAAGYHYRALDRFVQLADRVGEANTLANLGAVCVKLDRPAPAVDHNVRALSIFRELRHRGGEATVLDNLGDTYVALGRFADAVDHYRRALSAFRDLGERYGEACALNGLGDALAGLRNRDGAIACHLDALALARDIGCPRQEDRARGALAGLREPPPDRR